MKEAMEKAEKESQRAKLAQSFENKEFWENGLKTLEMNKQTFENNLAETEFLIGCYKEKLKSFE